MISFVSFSDELVKISQLAPLIKKMVPEGVKSLKRVQNVAGQIGRPGVPNYRNILGGKLTGSR